MTAILNGALFLAASRLLSGGEIWDVERPQVVAQLRGTGPAVGLFKWLALAWALAFIPATILSLGIEWVAGLPDLEEIANSADVLMGIPIVGALWSLLRHVVSGGEGRPTLLDDVVVVAAGIASWFLVPD
jgi:hypothetical protein